MHVASWQLDAGAKLENSIRNSCYCSVAGDAQVYQRTRLNVHPATYDAFGMTIVEAASQVRGSGAQDTAF